MDREPLIVNSFNNLSKIVHRFLLEKYRKYINDEAEILRDLPEELREPEIFTSIFPDKSKEFTIILNKTLIKLSSIKNQIIEEIDYRDIDTASKEILSIFDKLNEEIYELKKHGVFTNIPSNENEQLIKIKKNLSFLIQINNKIIEKMSNIISDVVLSEEELHVLLLNFLSSRSLAAVIQLQLRLNELISKRNIRLIGLKRVGEARLGRNVRKAVSEKEIVSTLHRAWAWLADRRFSYLRIGGEMKTLIENKDKIKHFFNEIMRDVGGKYFKVYKFFMEGKKKNLAEYLGKWLSSEVDSKLCSTLTRYLTELIFGVREALESAGFMPDEEILRSYLNACMVNFGFFEYEIYSLLLNEDFPAIPRLEVHKWEEEENRGGMGTGVGIVTREVDILTVDLHDYLVEVEVTAAASRSEVQERIERGPAPIADRLIVIAPEEALESVNCWDYDVACVPLEKPYRLVTELRGA